MLCEASLGQLHTLSELDSTPPPQVPEESETGELSEKELASLEREIALCKRLRHKHIVGYVGAQKVSTTEMYVFLEYVPGGSIAQMLTRFGCFNEQLVRIYTRQLLLGLEYLHGCKIIHRDLKGANVLVTRDGTVKLADFGAATLAKAIHDGHKSAATTDGLKSMRGSLFWMAPEVLQGKGYGRRADVWSAGCTVIEMARARATTRATAPPCEQSSSAGERYHLFERKKKALCSKS